MTGIKDTPELRTISWGARRERTARCGERGCAAWGADGAGAEAGYAAWGADGAARGADDATGAL